MAFGPRDGDAVYGRLSDRQAADAVRRCMDWKYALSLELSDPGFNFTLLHDFRERLVRHEVLSNFSTAFWRPVKPGWIKTRGKQRTDSTHVLAAIRTLNRLELVLGDLASRAQSTE